ncbi:hypothetical protein MAR_017328 [Mya arenaria]|uniref:Uncharacterized protein n=1 Tax=Mya arenaria TaxID=6604 RepID=A0ABY7EBF8_MYAAR|nr:hypothetical protein MAR_017328 [Mya arenaria]
MDESGTIDGLIYDEILIQSHVQINKNYHIVEFVWFTDIEEERNLCNTLRNGNADLTPKKHALQLYMCFPIAHFIAFKLMSFMVYFGNQQNVYEHMVLKMLADGFWNVKDTYKSIAQDTNAQETDSSQHCVMRHTILYPRFPYALKCREKHYITPGLIDPVVIENSFNQQRSTYNGANTNPNALQYRNTINSILMGKNFKVAENRMHGNPSPAPFHLLLMCYCFKLCFA